MPPVALIAGPTCTGKSALAIALAEACNGVVVNADSAQVYRDLRIVTARPSASEEARAPHRLCGYRDGAQPCSAGDWAADAKAAVRETHTEGKLPILTGGTGLYMRTLLEGIAPVPAIDPAIRAAVRQMPLADSVAALMREDPHAAAHIRPSDSARLARALEVIRSTGRSLSSWQEQKQGGIAGEIALTAFILLPPREWLYQRCDRRFEEMIGDEGQEEVRRLLDRKLNPLLPVMRAIGVRQIAGLVTGALSREQALELGRTATRQYAKRQYTWFRGQPPDDWIRIETPLEEHQGLRSALDRMRALLPAGAG